jgi:DNA-directed RNA polymerase specialized sigma subunit
MEGIYFSGVNLESNEGIEEEVPDARTVSDPKQELSGCRGRPNSLSEEKTKELISVYYSRPYSLRRLADMFGVSRMTIWRTVQSAQMIQL